MLPTKVSFLAFAIGVAGLNNGIGKLPKLGFNSTSSLTTYTILTFHNI